MMFYPLFFLYSSFCYITEVYQKKEKEKNVWKSNIGIVFPLNVFFFFVYLNDNPDS